MSEHPNVARYWRAYEAFSEGDADTIREMLADDLVWHVPGRHRFSGDRHKDETMALFEEVVPEFSETGDPVITTFNIEVEGIVATDEWIFTSIDLAERATIWSSCRPTLVNALEVKSLASPGGVHRLSSEALAQPRGSEVSTRRRPFDPPCLNPAA